MSDAEASSPGSLPWTRVNDLCDRYESAWRGGQRPRIEDYLGGTPEPERPVLFRALWRWSSSSAGIGARARPWRSIVPGSRATPT